MVHGKELGLKLKMAASKTIRKVCTRAHFLADRDEDRMRIFTIHKPWKGKEKVWSPSRLLVAKVLHSRAFELLMGFVIWVNVCITIWETDYEARCYPEYFSRSHACPFNADNVGWARAANFTMLALYTLEALGRAYVERADYVFSAWNRLDAVITIAGWACEVGSIVSNLAVVRVTRCVRMMRAFRVLVSRELYLLLNGVMSSIRAILYGSMFLIVMLVGYSIILVGWVHPYNSQIEYTTCAECTEGFRSVWFSVLTLFKELVAGNAWIMSFPLMENHWWIAVLMIIIIISVTLGVLNLILTVIVERATDAREADVQDKARHKAAKQFETKKKLMHMCAEMDNDGSGMVSLEELLRAFDTSQEFRNFMTLVGIQRDDLELTFRLLDTDSSGDLDYEEFCEELLQLESQDYRLSLAMLRYSVNDLRSFVERYLQTILVDIRESVYEQRSRMQGFEDKLDKALRQDESIQGKNQLLEAAEIADHTLSASVASIDMAVAFGHLHKEMQSLALLQADVVREVETQVSTMLSQAERAATVGEILGPTACAHTCTESFHDLNQILSNQQHLQLHSLVTLMKPILRQKMPGIIQEMQQNVRNAADTLDASANLLHAIQEMIPKTLRERRPPSPLSSDPASDSAPVSSM